MNACSPLIAIACAWIAAVGLAGAQMVPSSPVASGLVVSDPGVDSTGRMAVDVELVLAVDVSGSMNDRELRIQRDGYVAALQSDDVIRAIESGRHGRVAITYVEWARNDLQTVVLPWLVIDSAASARAAASKLAAAPLGNMRNTSIAGAIRHGIGALNGNGIAGDRLVIDISGDGPNNQGGPVNEARDEAVAQGITINGLPIEADAWVGANQFAPGATLADYFSQCVIGGPLAFVIPVREWTEFPEAVRRKLVLELSGLMPPVPPPVIRTQAGSGPDCMIGERQRRMWQDP
jgi:hypothetical protein